MGVERSVTRWYVQRHIICNEIAQLEAKLSPISTDETIDETSVRADVSSTSMLDTETELQQQLAQAQEKLHLLGPCPRPMMG
ncbi:MAG TPA: hypothetical protein VKR06_24980 [Ktedonosporobacter sp.]|nr:hypothetical protein [Ktedonosporobacter sp.]